MKMDFGEILLIECTVNEKKPSMHDILKCVDLDQFQYLEPLIKLKGNTNLLEILPSLLDTNSEIVASTVNGFSSLCWMDRLGYDDNELVKRLLQKRDLGTDVYVQLPKNYREAVLGHWNLDPPTWDQFVSLTGEQLSKAEQKWLSQYHMLSRDMVTKGINKHLVKEEDKCLFYVSQIVNGQPVGLNKFLKFGRKAVLKELEFGLGRKVDEQEFVDLFKKYIPLHNAPQWFDPAYYDTRELCIGPRISASFRDWFLKLKIPRPTLLHLMFSNKHNKPALDLLLIKWIEFEISPSGIPNLTKYVNSYRHLKNVPRRNTI